VEFVLIPKNADKRLRELLAEQETYPHAPIIEAVLDIRTRLSSPLSDESLTQLYEGEKDAYPTIRFPFNIQFKFEKKDVVAEPTTDTSVAVTGKIFASKDELQLFQARQDGFSHNRLAPYTDWASFQAEARRLWDKYRNVAKPAVVEMLGLNFINKILVPVGGEISDYFRTYVELPKELPQITDIHNFLIQVSDPDSSAKIAISTSLGPSNEAEKLAVTLNVQSFIHVSRALGQVTEDEIWGTFDKLRTLKNLAFESSITEKTRATFR
jgi:uncharacterized protein (TIGR04255 family)